MRTNATNLVDFYKSTKGEWNFTIVSFNPTTLTRELLYGGFDVMHWVDTMLQEGAKGNICILTNKDGYDHVCEWEEYNHRRISFEEMKPYRIVLDKNFETNRYGLRSGENVVSNI